MPEPRAPWVRRIADAAAELRGVPADTRARRAIERQLEYQTRKARALGTSSQRVESMFSARTAALCARLRALAPLTSSTRLLEVGSGAHGHVFFLDEACDAVGVDPLADHYRAMFPWQERARTIAAFGEALPFPDASFDIVLSDNVVDHAASPAAIVDEFIRVLAPGGLLYFTVNVHHPIYDLVSRAHGALGALGVPVEIGPFADHTVHQTARTARALLDRPELAVVSESLVEARVATPRRRRPRDLLKRVFFKNAVFEAFARGRARSSG